MDETIEIDTGPKPDAAVIWLHGLGADGHDFEPIVAQLMLPRGRAWRFLFPHAPLRSVTINGGMRMRAWYDIKGLDRHAAEDVQGFGESATTVSQLIAKEAGRGIDASRIVLAGFSQGGAVALYAVSRLAQKLAGVVGLSCYLPMQRTFLAERAAANDATPVFMAHGTADGTLPMSLGTLSRDYLRAQGYRIEWHEYPMAHSVCPEEIADIREYLVRVLD